MNTHMRASRYGCNLRQELTTTNFLRFPQGRTSGNSTGLKVLSSDRIVEKQEKYGYLSLK